MDQATYFDNLRQLPVESLDYRVYPSSLLRVGDDYWGVVEVSLQLTGLRRGRRWSPATATASRPETGDPASW